MKKKQVRRPDGLNISYVTDILLRFMSEKQMKDFHAKYKSTQLRSLENMEPTKEDIKWAKEYKEGLTIGEIAQKYGTYWERVDKGIRRVAFSKL